MTDWPARLAEWKQITDESNTLGTRMCEEAGGDDLYDEDEYIRRMDAYLDRLRPFEEAIIAADPAEPGAQGVQLQFLIENWKEQAPLQPDWQALLESLAAALILSPVAVFPTAAEASQ